VHWPAAITGIISTEVLESPVLWVSTERSTRPIRMLTHAKRLPKTSVSFDNEIMTQS